MSVPLYPVLPSVGVHYNQILVHVESEHKGSDIQVTYDDNKDSNYWSFHRGGQFPNVSGVS